MLKWSRRGLTVRFIETVRDAGKYYDSNGLYLKVSRSGRRYFEQRITLYGKRRTLGVGRYPVVSLQEAREVALENLRAVWRGKDPLARRHAEHVPTFAEAAARAIEAFSTGWSSPAEARAWMGTMQQHVNPRIGALSVSHVQTRDIIQVLAPLCKDLPDTARRARHRINKVMMYAVAQGWREDNPVGTAVDAALPRIRLNRRHHHALPHAQVAAALAAVRRSDAAPVVKLVFESLVLTAVRSGEARGACWSEIDLDAAKWTIPGPRMKAGVEHSVPLSNRCMEILADARALDGTCELVFPNTRGLRLSRNHLSGLLRSLQMGAVPHGFRSSFRDWCAETAVSREVAEVCLAHAVGNPVEQAYRRTDVFKLRRKVMEHWARYLAECGHCDVPG